LAAKNMLFWPDLGSRLTLWQIGVLQFLPMINGGAKPLERCFFKT
jgi:hypothetical protein